MGAERRLLRRSDQPVHAENAEGDEAGLRDLRFRLSSPADQVEIIGRQAQPGGLNLAKAEILANPVVQID